MSVDLPSQQACVSIVGDNDGIQWSGRGRKEGQRFRCERDFGLWVPDKLDGIADEESKCAILVLVILVAIFHKEIYSHLDLLL